MKVKNINFLQRLTNYKYFNINKDILNLIQYFKNIFFLNYVKKKFELFKN